MYYPPRCAASAHLAPSAPAVQSTGSYPDAANAGGGFATYDCAIGEIYAWVASLFWLLPNTPGVAQPRCMDSSPAADGLVETVAKWSEPLCSTAKAGCFARPCSYCGGSQVGTLADVAPYHRATSLAECLFLCARSASIRNGISCSTLSNRRGTDPYARWCGRGETARCPPIPINAHCVNQMPSAPPVGYGYPLWYDSSPLQGKG